MLRTIGGGALVAWSAPAIVTLSPVAAACGSGGGLTVTGAGTIGTLSAGQSLLATSTTYSSDTTFFVFNEQLTMTTATQMTDSGHTLPTSTPLQSHLVHFSPATRYRACSGTVTFPAPIVGWDWQDVTLTAGDPTWGVTGVTYGTVNRRLEYPTGSDKVTIAVGTCVVDLILRAGPNYVDQLRVYTQA